MEKRVVFRSAWLPYALLAPQIAVTVVFDAHGRPGGLPSTEQFDGVTVLFGSKRATADHVIERAAYRASQRGEGADVVVATDDRLERDVVGAMGVATMGARALEAEVARTSHGGSYAASQRP